MNEIIKIKNIMSVDLIHVDVDTLVDEIVHTMQDRKISSVIITKENKPLGIITERDIVKASLSPEKILQMSVTELMSSPVYTINSNADYRDAYMQMSDHKIRHVVVTDDNDKLVGILSESNFLNHLTPEQLLVIKEVCKVMTPSVLSCKPEDSLRSVLELMVTHKVGAIVVEENNRAVGLVSESDALKFIQESKTLLEQTVSSCMSSPVATIHKNQTVLNAKTLMEELHIRRLVVVDNDDMIAGIISRHDLIKHIPEYYVEILREMIDRQKTLVSKTQVELDEKIIFQNAVKSLPHTLVLMTQNQGIIQFINTQKSLVCKIPEIQIGDNLENLESNFFELLQGETWKEKVVAGQTLHRIIKIQNKSMEFCYFHTSISAIFDENNSFEGYLYIARDISQEQTLELELKRLTSHLKEAYHIANIGNWELDAKSLNAFWSDEICDMFGIPRDTHGGPEVLKTLVKEVDFEIIEKSLLSALQTGSNHELVYEVFPKDSDETRWVECRARRELNIDGSPKSLIGTMQDVTHRIQAEHNIAHLNSLLKAIRNINQLIVKKRDEETLLEAICDEIVLVQNFHGIWILTQNRERQFYSAGFEKNALNLLKKDIDEGRLPSCCVTTESSVIYREPIIECRPCALSTSYGNTDAVVVPISYEGHSYGYIGLSVGKNVTQDKEEQALVQEMANDIAFSLYNLDERKLHEKEQMRYKSLVEHSNDGIYMHTLEGVLIDVNPTLAKVHGCSKEELIGQNVMDFYPEEQLAVAESHFKAIQETGTVSFEMGLLKIDGTPFQAELVASLVEFDGEIVVQGSLRDVSKRFHAEQKAQENEYNMILALEGAGHGVWDWNAGEDTIYMSPQYKAMLGYENDEVENTKNAFFNLLHPDDLEETLSNIESFLKQNNDKQKSSMVFRLLAKDGTYRWILSNGNVVSRDGEGNILRVIGTHTDISEQKFEEEKFKRIFDDSPTGIIYYDADGFLVTCNHTFAQRLESDCNTLSNMPMYKVLKDEKLIQAMKDAIDRGVGYYEGWYEAVTINFAGYGRAVFKGIKDADGVIRHAVGLISDETQQKQLEDELRLFKRSVESSTEGITITKAGDDEKTIYVNPAFEKLTGYSSNEVIGENLRLLNEKNREQPEVEILRKAIENRESVEVALKNYRKDGSEFITQLSIDPILDDNNNVTHFVGIQKDITKERNILNQMMLQSEAIEKSYLLSKENERQLRQSATVFENTTEGVMITDEESNILNVNEAFCNITGREREEAIGKQASILKSGRHGKNFYKEMWNDISAFGSWRGEIWNRRKDGEVYPEWLNISSVKNSSGIVENYIAVFSDITALKETEAKLDFLAHHDHLTELPNRTLLKARLEHTLSTAKRESSMTAVMFMDLDNFKNINDSYGHTFGDELLVTVSKRIELIMREDDTFARIGGDEFVIVMSHFTSSDQIVQISRKIMSQFEMPFMVEDKELWVSISIGISISPEDGNSAETLIKNADTAMYEAKGDGKNTIKFYNDKMSASSFERVVFESALKAAISNREFEVYYQPQEDLQNNTIIGFEALVRWNHPSLGIVSPNRFIPIAEETKMILDIGELVLEQACKDIRKWHDEGLCRGRIAVNVSGVQLEHSEFAEILKNNLKRYNVDPSMIEIEVTESMVMKNPERWITILEEIKRIGVSISIDDFGTGYSSLSYLRRLPVDTLKIDQSFIQDIPEEKDACAIVDAIINMADSLGLNALAEGVETSQQREYLVKKDCQHSQGYLLSKPMNAKDTYSWLQVNASK